MHALWFTIAVQTVYFFTGYPKTLENDKHYASTYYQLKRNAPSIQAEIYARGSVTLAFTVYQDFLNYKSGKMMIRCM